MEPPMKQSALLFQDVDCVYMNKIELETKVDGLQDEINFLRSAYEAVRLHSVLLISERGYLFQQT